MKAVKIFYVIPYVFFVMLIEWRNCPTGMVMVEIPLFCLSAVLLGALGGIFLPKSAFYMWNLIQAGASGICVLVLAGLPYVNRCGNVWATYFKPFTAVQFFVFLQVLFWLIERITYALVRKRKA